MAHSPAEALDFRRPPPSSMYKNPDKMKNSMLNNPKKVLKLFIQEELYFFWLPIIAAFVRTKDPLTELQYNKQWKTFWGLETTKAWKGNSCCNFAHNYGCNLICNENFRQNEVKISGDFHPSFAFACKFHCAGQTEPTTSQPAIFNTSQTAPQLRPQLLREKFCQNCPSRLS